MRPELPRSIYGWTPALIAQILSLILASFASAEVALQIVAHQDDDLYFINPAVAQSIERLDSTWTVYVTAGDASLREPPQPPPGSSECDGLTYHWECRDCQRL